MKRMNAKADKNSSCNNHALCNHKPFKGDCNAAPRQAAKNDIEKEITEFEDSNIFGYKVVAVFGGGVTVDYSGCNSIDFINSHKERGKLMPNRKHYYLYEDSFKRDTAELDALGVPYKIIGKDGIEISDVYKPLTIRLELEGRMLHNKSFTIYFNNEPYHHNGSVALTDPKLAEYIIAKTLIKDPRVDCYYVCK